MSNYLYNGTELPPLPEWDMKTYPYTLIVVSPEPFGVVPYTRFYASKSPFIWKDYNPYPFAVSSQTDSYVHSLINEGETEWSEVRIVTQNGVSTGITENIIWTNHDILNEDGSVYFAASDPVPVPDEPDPDEPESVLAWKKHDAYKPNTKWNGHTFYKVIGNKWVKHDAVAPAETLPEDEPTGEPIAYSYNGVQLPDINEVWTDKVAYPYAMIKRAKSGGECTLFVYGDDPYYTEQAQGVEGGVVITPVPIQTFDLGNDGWVLRSEDADYGVSHRVEVFEFVWTNVDIKNKDNNSVYFPESEPPVPVYA